MALIEDLMVEYDRARTVKNALKDETSSPEAIEWFEKTFKSFKTLGQLYEVNIPEDETLLDYDKPFSEQPEAARPRPYPW
jgi:hypothetical protein